MSLQSYYFSIPPKCDPALLCCLPHCAETLYSFAVFSFQLSFLYSVWMLPANSMFYKLHLPFRTVCFSLDRTIYHRARNPKKKTEKKIIKLGLTVHSLGCLRMRSNSNPKLPTPCAHTPSLFPVPVPVR